MKKILIFCFTVTFVFFIACQGNSAKKVNSSNANSTSSSAPAKKATGGPAMTFDKTSHDFGIISEGDCIKHISDSKYYNMPIDKENTVEKNMASNVETIDKNMNIFDAATKFISSKRRRFPIVENGKLIGQISQKDILKAAIKVKGNNWK